MNLTLRGPRLADTDPVPLLMNQIHELAGADAQQSALFTILTELFINALDHGVLKLGSELKSERNGFEAYMEKRARRLENLTDGWVNIVVSAAAGHDGLEIAVTDSGDGFDVDAYYRDRSSGAPRPYGRGLALVRALSDSVEHDQSGTLTKARYRWR